MVFTGGDDSKAGVREERRAEELYRQTIINWQQARKWRLVSQPRVKKGAAAPLRQWRVTIKQEGLYRIEAVDLAAAGADLSALASADIQLVYGGGRPLPLETPVEVEWHPVPLVVEDGGDGRFEAGGLFAFLRPAQRPLEL